MNTTVHGVSQAQGRDEGRVPSLARSQLETIFFGKHCSCLQ